MFGRLMLPFWKYSVRYLQQYQHVPQSSAVISRRRTAKAAVVDDKTFAPPDNLRQQHFNIVAIGNPNTPTALEEFDIVVCDIQGVATEFDPELQGGGLIRAIRELYPDKYIIAYSAGSSISNRSQVAKAHSNARVGKIASTAEWTGELDKAVTWVFDPIKRWEQVAQHFERRGTPKGVIAQAEDRYVRSIVSGDFSPLREYSNKPKVPEDVRIVLRSLITSAIWTAVTGTPG